MKSDVLWGYAFGNWSDTTSALKRVKKLYHEGFYVDVNQLSVYEIHKLREALRDKSKFGNIDKPWKHLFRDSFDPWKNNEIFHLRLYGPGPIIHSMPQQKIEQRDHYVLQQDNPTAYPVISCALTRAMALRQFVKPPVGKIVTILKVMECKDFRLDAKTAITNDVVKLANDVQVDPTVANIVNLRHALDRLEQAV